MESRLERDFARYSQERNGLMLGKQKALESRKGKSLRQLFLLGCKILAGFASVVLIAVACLMLRDTLLHSPRFDLSIKEIHGLEHVSENQVLMKLKEIEEQNRNLFSLDLDHLRVSIERLSWVKEARIRRALPDKLEIYVTERRPVAYAKMDEATTLVDEDGIFLESKTDTLSIFDFPILVGLEAGLESDALSRNKKRISRYRELIQSLDENGAGFSKDISEIHLQDVDNVSVILNEDTVLVHLGNNRFQERFRRYLAMSRDIKEKYPRVDAVDFRFQNQVIINGGNEKIASKPVN
jgi:cell division protein FtsQ